MQGIEANPVTGKVLVRYEPDIVGLRRIVASIQSRPASARGRRAPRGGALALRLVARVVWGAAAQAVIPAMSRRS